MRKLFLIIFLLAGQFVFSQSTAIKAIKKIIDEPVVQVNSGDSYVYENHRLAADYEVSRTYKGDTIGVSYNNQQLMFRNLVALEKKRERYTFISNEYISVGDYKAFMNYVRDSIARMTYYYCTENDEASNRLISYDRKDPKFKPYERDENFFKYHLNWKAKFHMDDPEVVPCLASMYYPIFERYRRQKEIDQRKLIYTYYDNYLNDTSRVAQKYRDLTDEIERENFTIRRQVSLIPSIELWSLNEQHNHDQYSVLSQLYLELDHLPITGLTAPQIRAYYHWKADRIQKALAAEGHNFSVYLSSPSKEQIETLKVPKLIVPERDYTEQWQISTEEYQRFIQGVRDSVALQLYYFHVPEDEKAVKILDIKDVYFSESNLEYFELDPSDRYYNWEIGVLNRTKRNIKAAWSLIEKEHEFPKEISYSYSWLNTSDKARVGELKGKTCRYVEYGCSNRELELSTVDSIGEPIGRDLLMDWNFWQFESTGIRSFENMQRFIKWKAVTLSPVQSSEHLIQGISYEQALAFYHWKYRIERFEEMDWQLFVFPSENQFHRVQNGEKIVLPAEELNFPTPIAQVVYHFY